MRVSISLRRRLRSGSRPRPRTEPEQRVTTTRCSWRCPVRVGPRPLPAHL